MAGRMRRVILAGGAVILALAVATACAPEPAPSPSPTGFTSEEEAFAAAEETYRAYSDALNARRANAKALPDPNSFLAGSALQDSIAGAQRLQNAGLRLTGSSTITKVTPLDASANSATITVCIDSSSSRVLNEAGEDVTPVDRPAVSALEIEVVASDPIALILRSDLADGSQCS